MTRVQMVITRTTPFPSRARPLPHTFFPPMSLASNLCSPTSRTRELFEVLESLMPARVSRTDTDQPLTNEAQRKASYVPKVTAGQRSILEFLQQDLKSGWQLALNLLAKFSVEPGKQDSASQGSGAGEGQRGVTVECTKEVSRALSAVMSKKVPAADKALALEGLLSEVCVVCGGSCASSCELQCHASQGDVCVHQCVRVSALHLYLYALLIFFE